MLNTIDHTGGTVYKLCLRVKENSRLNLVIQQAQHVTGEGLGEKFDCSNKLLCGKPYHFYGR